MRLNVTIEFTCYYDVDFEYYINDENCVDYFDGDGELINEDGLIAYITEEIENDPETFVEREAPSCTVKVVKV